MKPTYWIVKYSGKSAVFFQRSAARQYTAAKRAEGHQVKIEAKGY